MFCEYDNLYYLCIIVRWRNGRAQAVDEKLSNGKNGYLIYRFESCPDYICITDWWSDLYGPNYLWG